MRFAVMLGVLLVVQLGCISPWGLRLIRRVVPLWHSRKFAFAVLLGVPILGGAAATAVSTLGEGAVLGITDLLAFVLLVALWIVTGFARGHIDDLLTAPDPPPDPWRLLSFADRCKIKRALRQQLLPPDLAFLVTAAEWVDAVLDHPEERSPRQQDMARRLALLLGTANVAGRPAPQDPPTPPRTADAN